MKFLFPYMARWKAVNWTRYYQIFTKLAEMGHDVYVLQPPASNINETNLYSIIKYYVQFHNQDWIRISTINRNEEYERFLTFTFGMLIIAVGGILGILDNWTFWFPLGMLTIPWISSIIGLYEKEEGKYEEET